MSVFDLRQWLADADRAGELEHVRGADAVLEIDYAGAILGEPVPFVRGPDTGLPIPAESELAFEGWLYPDRTRPEGPFGEWTGYYSGAVTR